MPRPLIHQPALTGPAAAALYGLEGFNHRVWPHRYTTFTNGQSRRGVLRTTRWMPPTNFDGQLVADLGVVCQQLGYFVADMEDDDGVTPMERIELAVEHARRIGHHVGAARGGGGMGSVALRQILSWAGDEPPTESYAETRAAQLFRGWGIDVWRQVPVLINRKRYRVDFVVRPSRRAARPQVLRPFDGLIVEVDGEEFHSKNFEADYERWSDLTRAGFHFVNITARQVRDRPAGVLATIGGALARDGFLNIAQLNPQLSAKTKHETRS